MESLNNLISISWWSEALEGLSFADFSARMTMIRQALANPQVNLPIALLAFAIILLFILLVMLTLWMVYVSRKKPVRSYELLDDQGNLLGKVGKDQAELFIAEPEKVPTARRTLSYSSIIGAMVGVLLVLFGLGVGTSTDVFCGSCHENPHDLMARPMSSHENLSCVQCHESGSSAQRSTVNLLPRVSHSLRGIFSTEDTSDLGIGNGYGNVSTQACSRCHESIVSDQTTIARSPSGLQIRMSHTHPLEAGMPCIQCHYFTENQMSQTKIRGMQTCLYCHDGTNASVECVYCHKQSPTSASREDVTDSWARRIVDRSPHSTCYDCHDPKSCDACHGTRVPHAPEYMDVESNYGYLHADDYARIGRQCFLCHFEGSVSGAAPCSDCHGDLYK